MDVTFDPVAFFAAHAARHLIAEPGEDPRAAVSDVFNKAYPYAMPMEEYARKTLRQARRVNDRQRREKTCASLAQYAIVHAVIAGDVGDATDDEKSLLKKARARLPEEKAEKFLPEERRPAEGSVIVARHGEKPFVIANVRWATDFVEQRWMHQDRLDALLARLVADPPEKPFVIAVAGRPTFSPSSLAFSGRGRLAVCHPDRAEYLAVARYQRLQTCFADLCPDGREDAFRFRKDLFGFRNLCRDRARTADTPKIDKKLIRLAETWQRDVNALHDLLLPASDVEIRALTDRPEE